MVTILGIAYSGEDEQTQRQLVNEGGLKASFKALHSDHHEVPVAAASLIGNIVLLEENKDRVLQDPDHVRELIEAGSEENTELLHTLLVAVANLASEEKNVKYIRNAGGVEWFIAHANSEHSACRDAAFAGLANFANSRAADELMKNDVLKLTLPALQGKAIIAKRGAAQTIANLSMQRKFATAVLDECLTALIKLASTRDTRVQVKTKKKKKIKKKKIETKFTFFPSLNLFLILSYSFFHIFFSKKKS